MKKFGAPALVSVIVLVVSYLSGSCLLSRQQDPTKADIVGTWILDQASLETLKVKGGYRPTPQKRLIIYENGTFQLFAMPDWWSNPFGESGREFENDQGTWEIQRYGNAGPWQVLLKASSGTRLVTMLGRSPSYELEFIIGDPDMKVSMVFIRQ